MATKTKVHKKTIPVPGTLAKAAGAATRWPVLCIAGAAFVFIAVNSLLCTSWFADTSLEIVTTKRDAVWLNLLVLAGFTALLFWLGRLARNSRLQAWLTRRRLQGLLCLFALAGGTVWVVVSGSAAYAEPANISANAMALNSGEYSSMGAEGYYTMFPYQLGFTAYVQLVYTVFGAGNDTALQLLNVLFVAGSFWLASELCHRMFRDEAATALCCLLLYGCVYMLLLCTFTYGTIPGLFFALLALWLATKTMDGEGAKYLALAGVALGLAVVMKINYLIFAVAVLITGFIYFLREGRVAILGALALVALCGFGAMQPVYLGYSLACGHRVGQEGVPFTVNVVMGLDMDNYYMAPGWYNGYTYSSYVDNDFVHAAAVEEADTRLKACLKAMAEEPGRAARFLYEKTLSQWNEPTHQSVMLGYHAAQEGFVRGKIVNDIYDGTLTFAGWFVETFMDKIHLLVYTGAALGILIGRRRLRGGQLLCAMVFVGGFMFQLVWEAKSQYIGPYFLLCVPYAALGWVELYRRIGLQWQRRGFGQKQRKAAPPPAK